jgi:pimeloyl-ACP methyl ester carboxylesterase
MTPHNSQPDPSRPCLVYLPGLDGTGKLLYKQTALLRDYTVHEIAYPQDRFASYDELAELAAVVLRQAGCGIVLAESFGGAVALTLALKHPELLERMVLVNTFAYFPRRWLIQAGAWLGQFLPDKPSHPSSREIRAKFFFSPDISPQDRAEWWNITGVVPMRAFGYRMKLVADLDMRMRLAAIHTPTLVLVAPDDRVVPPAAGLDLARRLPNARLLRLRAGHAAMVHPKVDIAQLLAEERWWDHETENAR